jgi:predicted HTH transcriptional regulator
MDHQSFEEILQFGHELPGLELKPSGQWSDTLLRAWIIKAILAMANRRGGGRIIVGIRETKSKELDPCGFSAQELKDWSHDSISDVLSAYADPFVDVKTEIFEYKGRRFVEIVVQEFDEIPVLCKRDFSKDSLQILRRGACYIRRRGKPESCEVPDQSEMRDLLALAVEKGLRKFIAQANGIGVNIALGTQSQDLDAVKFEQQTKGFL